MKERKYIIVAAVLVGILAILIIINTIFGNNQEVIIPSSDKTWAESTIFTNPAYQKKQKENIKAEFNAFESEYTLDNPYIKVDPYSINPLSAYVIFDSKDPVKYSYEIASIDEGDNFTYSTSQYVNKVVIPVIGLYENNDNQVTINTENKKGKIETNTISIPTSEVTYNEVKVKMHLSDIDGNIKNGWFFDSFYNAFDNYGNIRYNLNVGVEDNYMKFIDNDFYVKVDDYQTIYELNIMGEIQNTYRTPSAEYNFHHDLTKTPDGTVYALGSYNVELEDIPYAESFIFKYDKSGTPSKIIDLYDYFDENLVSSYGTPNKNDSIHINSIDYIEKTKELVISSQAQSFIAGINTTDYTVDWVIQDDKLNIENKDLAMTVVDKEKFEETSGQHTAFLTNNSKYDEYRGEDKEVLSVFNNNNCKDKDGNLVYKKYSDPIDNTVCTYDESDVLIYALDFKNKTVEQIDSFTINDEYAPIMSSVFDAAGDNYMVHFNRVGKPKSYLIDNEGNILIDYTVNGYSGNGYYRTNFRSRDQINEMLKKVSE